MTAATAGAGAGRGVAQLRASSAWRPPQRRRKTVVCMASADTRMDRRGRQALRGGGTKVRQGGRGAGGGGVGGAKEALGAASDTTKGLCVRTHAERPP